LKVGETSQAIPTPLGFELFRLEELKTPKLEEVRQEVDNAIRQRKYETLYQEMKARSSVKVDEGFFGIAPTAAQQGRKN